MYAMLACGCFMRGKLPCMHQLSARKSSRAVALVAAAQRLFSCNVSGTLPSMHPSANPSVPAVGLATAAEGMFS